MSKQTAALFLETKNLMGRGLKSASSQVDRFATKTKSAARTAHSSISKLGDKTAALGRANASFMIGLGAIGAVGFGIKKTFDVINAGLKPAEDLEQAMANVRAVMSSMTDKSMIPRLRAQALALSGSGDLAFFTAVQVSEAQKMLVKSGMDATKVMGSVAATMAIAGAENIDLGNAADFTTNIMKAFKLEARQSADAANMLAEASRTSNTNITELADGAAQGAADFKIAGGSLGEFLALQSTLANFGIKGGEAGTGIKAMGVSMAKLAQLGPAGDKLRALLKIDRSDIVNAQGNIDAIKALAVIGRATGLDRIRMEDKYGKQTEESAKKASMGNAEVTRILSKIFKQYQFGKVAILAQEAALGEVEKTVININKQIGKGRKGAAFEVITDRMDTVTGSAIQLSSAWNTLLTNLGNPILGIKRGFIDFLTGSLNLINSWVTGVDIVSEKVRNAGVQMSTRTGASSIAAKDFFISRKTRHEQKEIAVSQGNQEIKRTFGVGTTAISDFLNPVKPEETDSGKSETNIIFTGDNEFHNESLEKQVKTLTGVSFGYAQ